MKPETAYEKIMNETFVQIIHLLNNSERTVVQFSSIFIWEFAFVSVDTLASGGCSEVVSLLTRPLGEMDLIKVSRNLI